MDHTGQHVQLIETALEGLRRTTGLTANITRLDPHMVLHQDQNQRFDTFIEIQAQHRKYQFAVEARLGVRTELLTQIRALWPHNQQPPLLVVAPYITNYLAEKCREIQLPFLDTAGNAYLADHDLFIYVTGQKKPPNLAPAQTNRTNTAAGLRVLFAKRAAVPSDHFGTRTMNSVIGSGAP